MKTKISWVLVGLGVVCGSGYAAHREETPMPVSNDINVTAPHQSGTWSFAAEAVWLQPINQAFSYADLYTETTSAKPEQETQENVYKDVNQSYHGWFGADITYGFPGNGRDVTLAYEGLQGNDTAHTSANANEALYSIPYNGSFATASGETQTNYDAADLLFGQSLDVGARISLHPFVGLRYATINEKNTASYNSLDLSTVAIIFQESWQSRFNGIGPRFGSDAAINLGDGFSIRGRLGLSALVGSAKPDFSYVQQNYLNATGELLITFDYAANQEANIYFIPEIDGRLGLNYTYNFKANVALGIEAGWQASNYFNAIYQLSGNEMDQTVTSNNFGLQGPYARLQLDIA